MAKLHSIREAGNITTVCQLLSVINRGDIRHKQTFDFQMILWTEAIMWVKTLASIWSQSAVVKLNCRKKEKIEAKQIRSISSWYCFSIQIRFATKTASNAKGFVQQYLFLVNASPYYKSAHLQVASLWKCSSQLLSVRSKWLHDQGSC